MSKWEMVKISDFADVITGGTPSTSKTDFWENGKIPWLQSGVCQNCVIKSCDTFITELGLKNSSAKMMSKGSVLIALTGATTGKVGLIDFEACANQSVTGIQPNSRYISKFLFFYLVSIRNIVISESYGGAQKHISQGYVKNLKIPFPPIETQKQIAKTLDTAAELLAMRKQQLAELDNLIKSTFYDMFGDPVTNEKEWRTVTLGDLITVLTDYHANGSYENLRNHVELLNEPNYALMIRTTDLENENYVDDVKYITKEAYEYLEKSKVFGGEIIINKIGSAGNVYLMPYLNRPVSLAMNQFLLRFNDNTNVLYVYYYLNTEFSKKNISERVRGAVTKTITKDAIRSIPFRLPPLSLQIKFSTIITRIEEHKTLVKKAIDKTQYLFDSLMSEYFE